MDFDEDPKLQWCSLGPVNESRFMQRATHDIWLVVCDSIRRSPFSGMNQTLGWSGLCGTFSTPTSQPNSTLRSTAPGFCTSTLDSPLLCEEVVELKPAEADKDILLNSVTDNSSAFHQETILLAMATDHRFCANRVCAVRTILDICAGKVKGKKTEQKDGI